MPVAAVAAIAAAGSIAGGVMQANAQKDASKRAAESTAETNRLNYEMFQQSRGKGGSAILPTYLPSGTEQALAEKAVAASNAIMGNPEALKAEYQAIVNQMVPVIDAATGTVVGLYDGRMEGERMAANAPVNAARTQAAESNAAAIQLALQNQIAQIRAADAAKGYVGGGSYLNNRMLAAAIPAEQQAAAARSVANLQNAQAIQAIQEQQQQLKLANVNLPAQMAAGKIQLLQMPAAGVATTAQASQVPLQFFKLPVGNPPLAQAAPTAVVPSTGGIIASGLGQFAGQVGNYYANQALINQLNQGAGGTGTYGGGIGTNYNYLMNNGQMVYPTH